MIAVALWHNDKLSSVLKAEALKPNTNQKILYSKYSLISTGTEKLVASGSVPTLLSKLVEVPYMAGSFDFPVKYGYAVCGEGEVGEYYHLMHPHQNLCIVNETDLYKINNKIPPHRVPLISNIETVLNAIWDTNFYKDDLKIAICGFGNIGSLLALTLKIKFGKMPVIVELNEWRLQKAKQLGFEVDQKAINYDIIYHTTATEVGLQYCINHLNIEGQLIELSWYGDMKVSLSLGENFHINRLKLISSQVSKIPLSKQKEISYQKRKEIAAEILLNDAFDELISDYIDFENSPAFFKDLRKGNLPDGLIWMIKY